VNNLLVRIDPSTGQVVQTIGSTGFPKLFGVAFAQDKIFGFVHSNAMNTATGQVIQIDPKTGVGTLYNTFMDPSTGMPISFSGAGVNAMVMEAPIG
jgi:hypothetical protein